MKEEWRDIAGYEGYYQVSNYGRIKGLTRQVKANKSGGIKTIPEKQMKLTTTKDARNPDKNGYVFVNLRNGKGRTHPVHRLMADAFIANPDNLPEVNHIDGNKTNNMITNLEWCTYSYNNQHALDNNLRKPRGCRVIQYDLQGNYIKEYRSVTEAARYNKIERGSISHCLNGRQETYKGYIWKYK